MTVTAWLMDDSDADQRLPHKRTPHQPVSVEALASWGVVVQRLSGDEDDAGLAAIREERGYNYTDIVDLKPETLPDYERKIRSFFEEHMHADEEVRYILDGSGYFDVRSADDVWVRIAVSRGDVVILPAGVYHRFTMDTDNYIKAMRLFKGEPVWTPLPRPQDEHDVRKSYVEQLSKTAVDCTLIKDGWFSERAVMWPGQRFSLEVENVLFHERSELQDVLVFDSKTYGRVLVLDGVVQLTERDEASYQEMIVHLPLMAHAKPRRVCIVGGGDGGALREVCRHDCVESITMCEIDAGVIAVAKRFLSGSTATSFDDPRVKLVIEDAAAYLERHAGEFDVIIVDSSDPVGPADVLFQPPFYHTLQKALAPGGIVSCQGECLWLHLDLIAEVMTFCGQLFDTVNYAYTTVPTYPSGQIGFILASKGGSTAASALCRPARPLSPALAAQMRYYSPDLHAASFVLPQFAEARLADCRKAAPLAAPAKKSGSKRKPLLLAALAAAAYMLK
eukprot:PLAT3403.1.p1 GENE.PLAT3403.1~~PLAT3403.1.p1  ORF type:complete len:514 (-),score=283.18 PLAT3403.1:60-1574(-)